MSSQPTVMVTGAMSGWQTLLYKEVLRFKVDRELPPALARSARVTGRIVQLPAQGALEIEQYLAAVRQAGLVVEDVEIRKADLEDVFLDVMTKNRDVAREVSA